MINTSGALLLIVATVFLLPAPVRAGGCYDPIGIMVGGDACTHNDPFGPERRALRASEQLESDVEERRRSQPHLNPYATTFSPRTEFMKAIGAQGCAKRLRFKPQAPILPDLAANAAPKNERHEVRERIRQYLDAYKAFAVKGLFWGNAVHPHMLFVEVLYNVATGDKLTTSLAGGMLRDDLQNEVLFGALGNASDRDKQVIAELWLTVAFEVLNQSQQAKAAHDADKLARIKATARRLLIADVFVDPNEYPIDKFVCGVWRQKGQQCQLQLLSAVRAAQLPPLF